jgi:hypothetical protein
MAIPIWRVEGTFSGTSLEAFFHGIKGYTPGEAPRIGDAQDHVRPECILPTDLYARLELTLPVDDLLAWILETYPEAGVGEVVRAYGRVIFRDIGTMHFGTAERRYPLPEATLVARPLRLEKIG